jgi:hypothetical protein
MRPGIYFLRSSPADPEEVKLLAGAPAALDLFM